MAGFSWSSKSIKRDNWLLILWDHSKTVSSVFNWRSWSLKDGSPIIPVPPPTNAIGTCPFCWKRRNIKIGNKWPICRLSAVGSKPIYSFTDSSFNCLVKAASSVVWWTNPRCFSSSKKSVLILSPPNNCFIVHLNWKRGQWKVFLSKSFTKKETFRQIRSFSFIIAGSIQTPTGIFSHTSFDNR